MTHYTVTPPDITVAKLIKQLQEIADPEAVPMIWNEEASDWSPITGFTYGGSDNALRFFADEP